MALLEIEHQNNIINQQKSKKSIEEDEKIIKGQNQIIF